MRRRAPFRHIMLATTALVPLGILAASANPLAPNVVGGGASVTGVGTANVTVNQTTPRAIINWNTFNIGAGETTRFVQPSASSVALNRVIGGLGPSQINGMLTANGQVFLVNPDGVMISKSGVINTAGFLATTHDIANADFMAGRYNFNISGRPTASIVNEGTINSHSHGFAALVAPGVRNSGTISAKFGTVALASGNSFTLDLYGDNLIKLAANDSIASQVLDVATGQPLTSLVKNDGKLKANGGRVELTAVQARTIVDSVINNTGVIEARTVGTRNGKIVLGASTTNVAGLPPQTVKVSGKLDVSSKKGKGGTIQVTGEKIVVQAASFDASGKTGGGKVLIGGDVAGGKGNSLVAGIPQAQLEIKPIPNATIVEIDAATTINASATSIGDGGKIVIWADGATTFSGTILARGGDNGGNGGFAEVSGKQTLGYFGTADLRAPAGGFGTLLLDPYNVTISTAPTSGGSLGSGAFTPGANSSNLNVTDLQNALAMASIIVTTGGSGSPGTQDGDITVQSSIFWSANSTLTLDAFRNVQFNDNVIVSNTGGGSLVVRADNSGSNLNTGNIIFQQFTYGSRIDWTASTGTVKFIYNPSGGYASPTDFTPAGQGGGTRGVTTNIGVANQFQQFLLVNSDANLQSLVNGRNYALGKDISGTSFNMLPFNFNGIFDGLGHTISGLTINGRGLFQENSGTIRNLTLANMSASATTNNQAVGLLVGQNLTAGKLEDITISNGTVNGGSFYGVYAGLLAGQNHGQIINAAVDGTVTVGNGIGPNPNIVLNFAGGLVGMNTSSIIGSDADVAVTVGGFAFGGGLVGLNSMGALIDLSSAMGDVSSMSQNVVLGGLAGSNNGGALIRDSFALGNVTASASIPSTNNCNSVCPMVVAGGLVGENQGTVSSLNASTVALGNVSVGSNAIGGGLIGVNWGVVHDAVAAGNVTGLAGVPVSPTDYDTATTLGGLVGVNRGLINESYAFGSVGSIGVDRLLVGGLAGVNSGTILNSGAISTSLNGSPMVVSAGNFSQAGGLVGSHEVCENCPSLPSDGSAYFNTRYVSDSFAFANVTVGNNSLAGGFAGSGSNIYNSFASGAVTGGNNAVLGGFVGAHDIGSVISDSYTYGMTVTSTGPATWVGGFVGFNAGMISYSAVYNGVVNAASDNIVGGFAGMNIGSINYSTTQGSIAAQSYNLIGGFAGANFGSLNTSEVLGSITATGTNNIIGSLIGANAMFTSVTPSSLPSSSFPVGTYSGYNTSGTISPGANSTVGQPVGVNNPSSLPSTPFIVSTCSDAMCQVFQTGKLPSSSSTSDDPQIPNQIQAPPVTRLDQPVQHTPVEGLIQMASLNLPNQSFGPRPGGAPTGPGARPGVPPQSLAPPRPLRPVAGPDGETRSNVPPLNETRFLANEVVLHVMANNNAPASVQQIAQQLGLTLLNTQNLNSLGRIAFRLQIGGGRSVRDIIRTLEANSIVAVAQPNYSYSLVQQAPAAPAAIAPFTASRGDPAQYSMGKLQLNDAHRVASGNNITVAVIDSEVDADHAEIKGTIAQTYDATDTQARAHSHGTAMAGAIVSRDRLLGVAPGARILAIRAFSETQTSAESTSFNIMKGIEWAVSQGARVINMSFAGPYDPSLERALKDAAAKGVVLIGASGNAGPKSPPLWPGADPNVIAVTATDSGDKVFRQANRGPYISVSSPGVEILAPAPQAGYQMSTGTSIATAHVSGVVALMLERDPTLTPADVRLILESTASDLGPKGRDTQFGWGLVNPSRALAMVDERKRQKGTSTAPSPAAAPVQR